MRDVEMGVDSEEDDVGESKLSSVSSYDTGVDPLADNFSGALLGDVGNWSLSMGGLALAAGLCLPLLASWGYAPGVQSEAGLNALSLAYGVLPCVLKSLALAALVFFWIQPSAALLTPRSNS